MVNSNWLLLLFLQVLYKFLPPCITQDAGELGDIDDRLQKDGYRTNLPVEHKLRYFWRQFLRSETSLKSSLESVEQLRKQHGEEMIEVENYVAHIRQLSDEREALTQELETENEQLKAELEQMKVEKEAGAYVSEDICDLLTESGLTQIGRDTNPVKEQVNYLIKERASLSEKVKRLELDNETLKNNSNSEQSDKRLMKIMEEERKDMEEEMNRMREMMKQVKQEERKIHEQEVKKVTDENDSLRAQLDKVEKQHSEDLKELINRHQGLFLQNTIMCRGKFIYYSLQQNLMFFSVCTEISQIEIVPSSHVTMIIQLS